jgi:hypothetical protein
MENHAKPCNFKQLNPTNKIQTGTQNPFFRLALLNVSTKTRRLIERNSESSELNFSDSD